MGEKMKSRAISLLGAAAVLLLIFSMMMICVGPFGAIDSVRYLLLASAVFYVGASGLGRKWWIREKLESILAHPRFPFVMFFVFSLAYVRIKFLQLPAGQISGMDFSHLDYAIWSTSRGEFMQIPILAPQNSFLDFFGNHYSPVLFFHVLARFVVDSPLASLAVHALSLSAAIPVLHALARKLVDRVTASFLTLNYALCGAVASTLQFDIHQESFYPLAFGFVFLGLYSRRAFLWGGAILALLIKEDAGVYLLPAFLLLAVLVKSRRYSCFALALVSACYTLLVLKVLMPMHQPLASTAPYYLPMWAKYGHTFSEVARSMFSHPHWVAADVIFNKDLYKNLMAWGFLPLLNPVGAIMAAPVVVSSTAAGVQKSFGLYYGIVLVPIFFFASARFLQKKRRARLIAAGVLCVGAFVGGSFLRFPAPLPFLGEIREAAAKLSLGSEEKVIVQSGLLPFLPYEKRWQRFDGLDEIGPAGNSSVVLFAGLSLGSLPGGWELVEPNLLAKGYRLVEISGRLRIYR